MPATTVVTAWFDAAVSSSSTRQSSVQIVGLSATADLRLSPPMSADLLAELRRPVDKLGPIVACGRSLAAQKERLTSVRIALYYLEVRALRRRLGLLWELLKRELVLPQKPRRPPQLAKHAVGRDDASEYKVGQTGDEGEFRMGFNL